MSSAQPSLSLYERLEALPDTVVGEILDGQLYAHPRPAPKHLRAADRLGRTLARAFDEDDADPGGWILVAEPEIHFLRKVEVDVPDLAGWRRERLPALPETAFFEVVPDWVCEVLSPGTARIDREIKLPIYARYGVAYAWLVDPDRRSLEAFAREAGGWRPLGAFVGDATLAVAPFEALAFALGRLWR